MIRVGARVPEIEARTDEGTPISLGDMEGRGLVVFLLGEMAPDVENFLSMLSDNTGRFLALDFSPVAVLGESVDKLAAYRERCEAPYLLLSDANFSLHRRLRGSDGEGVGVWIIDETGLVIDTVPMLPAADLVSLAYHKASRVAHGLGRNHIGE
jgi:peroxiredoxin